MCVCVAIGKVHQGLECAADLEMMAERKENVESQDEIVVAVEQLPDSLDHVRRVDHLSLELREELEKLLV